MLSERERRKIGELLEQGSLLALCHDLSACDQRRLVKWLQYKFRRCVGCGYPFPLTAAPIKRCEQCRKALAKAENQKQYAENREYYLDHSRRYKAANRERVRAQNREYKKNNPEIIRNNHKTYRQMHPDRVLAQVKSWQKRNPDRVKAHGRAGYQRKIAKLTEAGLFDAWRLERNAKHRAWYAANRDEILARDKNIRATRERRRADPTVVLQWPYVTKRTSENELLLTINALIPRQIQGDLRGDIGNDILIATLDDRAVLSALLDKPSGVNRFITAARRQNYERGGYGVQSIDEPRRDGRSWHDVLTDHSP